MTDNNKTISEDHTAPFSLADLTSGLDRSGYVVDEALAVPLHLMTQLSRPLLLEGEAGVGKTELAAALSRFLDTKLIRLQCYEGLDASAAIYEWNYQRQLLEIRLHQTALDAGKDETIDLYSDRFLLKRPLLQSISELQSPVLLIDEIDRADEEFEAFLLELLSEFQVTIPEFGTVKAITRPHVILTSNGTRELSDALRRRCLYAYVDYPSLSREAEIIAKHIPDMDERLIKQVSQLLAKLRTMDLRKRPGVAEAIDWASALMCLDIKDLKDSIDHTGGGHIDASLIDNTVSCLLKTREDHGRVNMGQLINSLSASD